MVPVTSSSFVANLPIVETVWLLKIAFAKMLFPVEWPVVASLFPLWVLWAEDLLYGKPEVPNSPERSYALLIFEGDRSDFLYSAESLESGSALKNR